MCYFYLVIIAVVVSTNALKVDLRDAFDQELYERVLDPVLCEQQLVFLRNDSLGLQFVDASGKIPSGLTGGHLADLGDYYQCLGINELKQGHDIQGKYCTIRIPLDQNPIVIPELPEIPEWPDLPDIPGLPDIPWPPRPDNETEEIIRQYSMIKYYAHMMSGAGEPIESRVFPLFSAAEGVTLGVCVPRACTPTQAVSYFQDQVPFLNFTFTEYYCRLPNDKPFVAADYTAMAIFSLLAALTIISTTYDLYQVFGLKRDPSQVNALYRSFSLYTNTSRFLTFKPVAGALECVDGIRALSMLWVIVGHTYSMTLLGFLHNLRDTITWISSLSAAWVNSAPITVDTFFLLSGILCVYSTVGKVGRARFASGLHMFYLNRLLRMFPLLAAVVLLQASLFNHVADGPFWHNVAQATVSCRRYWWAALLHVQNYVNPVELCLFQSWYLSVDVQMYMVCPVVLFWLFGRRSLAWAALAGAVLLALVASTTYSFLYNFTAALNNPYRLLEFNQYIQVYYMNTLPRAAPFCIGLAWGYLLHQYRGRKIIISPFVVYILWTYAFLMMAFCIFSIHPVNQQEHEAQLFDNFLNAYMRAIWALAVGWMIFACVHGYGGAVNWFLSLQMWKLPARLSYAMYLIHLQIIVIANATWVKTHYFADGETLYRFSSDVMLSFLAAFVLCVTIDAPFSTLQKLLFGGGMKRSPRPQPPESQISVSPSEKYTIKTSL